MADVLFSFRHPPNNDGPDPPPPPPSLPLSARHLYAVVTGAALLAYFLGASLLLLLPPALATYAAMARLRDHAGTLAWIAAWSYLLAAQVTSARAGTWKNGGVDATGALMVLTLKLTAAAVAYQDGGRLASGRAVAPKKEDGADAAAAGNGAGGGDAAPAPPATPSPRALSPYAAAHALPSLPSPLEFASYCLSGGGLLSGPFFELDDYTRFVERAGPWASPPPPPPPAAAAAARVAKAVLCGTGFVLLSRRFGPASLAAGAPFFAAPLPLKFAWLWAAGVTDRMKYYSIWALAEASLMVAGFSYVPAPATADGRPSFDRYVNARATAVELATSAADLPRHWNVCTGHFLRHYVYERLTRGRRGGLRVVLATQAIAGLWHGTLPGYALFFTSSAFMFEASKALYRYERHSWPAWVARFPPWVAAKWAFTAACLNYSSSAFILLDWAPSVAVWGAVHFLPSAVMAAIVLVSRVVPPRRARRAAR